MSKSINRRDLVKVLGGAAGAGIIGTLAARAESAQNQPNPAGPSIHALPWPYQPLDPDAVAQLAFADFYHGECMYGVTKAIAGSTAAQLGAPFTEFPFWMFKYGGGGINGWGTVCGTLAGSAAAFYLLSDEPAPLIDALFIWYESEALPNFHAKGSKFPEIRSVSDSPLCHVSISKWVKKANKKVYSPERAERCANLVSSVARKAVQLLNEQAADKPILTALPASTQNCMNCHEKGGILENERGKMNCGGCHAPLMSKHPEKL